MAKRKKKAARGVPEWVVTFGDMMSLLLCFFILLQMFSEIKRDHEYQRVITAIKEAFGYSGGVGVLPIDDPPVTSIIEKLEEMMVAMQEKEDARSQSNTNSIDGTRMRVRKLREGVVFTIGGPAMFDEFSAEIKPSAYKELKKLSVLLAGRNNKIEIRGHAASKYLKDSSAFKDLDDLSYARAKNVKNLLVELGLEDRVFRIEAVGTREPVRPRAIDPTFAAENRRVEIILTEQLVEENNTDSNYTNQDLARGE
ncbi:MAG: flagellar motor protein MotB [Planctomycetes bacterium]|nr:flagellar motor protein MotB [Planctomycetota bacterium]